MKIPLECCNREVSLILCYLREVSATASYQTFLEEAKNLDLVTENSDPSNLETNQSVGVRLCDIIHWYDALHTSSMDAASSRLQQESERAISSIKMLLVAATARQEEFDALKKKIKDLQKPKLSRKRRRDGDDNGKARRTTTERQRHRNSNEASSAFVGTSQTVTTTAKTHDNDCRKGSTVASNFPQQQNISSCENRNAQNQYSLHFRQPSLNMPLTPSPREMGGKEVQHHEKVQHSSTQHLHTLRDDHGAPQQQNGDHHHIEVAGPGDGRGAGGTRRHESRWLALNSGLDDAGPPPLAPPPRFLAFGSIFGKLPHSLSESPSASCRNRLSLLFLLKPLQNKSRWSLFNILCIPFLLHSSFPFSLLLVM